MKRRVGKKFGTIFSKRSSGGGGRFEKKTFLLLNIFTSTAIKVLDLSTLLIQIQISCLKALPNHDESILNKSKIIFEICTKTRKLSELQKHGGCFLHPRHSQTYS